MKLFLVAVSFTFIFLGSAHAKSSYVCDHRTGSKVFSNLKLRIMFDSDAFTATINVLQNGRLDSYSPTKGESSVLSVRNTRAGWVVYASDLSSSFSYSSKARAYQFSIKEITIGSNPLELTLSISKLGSPHTLSGFGLTCYKSNN